jgi:carbonic anhydrase
MPPLLDDMPEQVCEVLDAVSLDVRMVIVMGVDDCGELHFDTNVDDPEMVQAIMEKAVDRWKKSLD